MHRYLRMLDTLLQDLSSLEPLRALVSKCSAEMQRDRKPVLKGVLENNWRSALTRLCDGAFYRLRTTILLFQDGCFVANRMSAQANSTCV